MSVILAFPGQTPGPSSPIVATGEQIDAGLGESMSQRLAGPAPERGNLDEILRNLYWSIGSLVVKLNELSVDHPGLVAGTEFARVELALVMRRIGLLRNRLGE
jgi:hypothetical protein